MLRVRAVSQGWTGGPGLSTFYFGQNSSTDVDDATMADDVSERVHAVFASHTAIWPTNWTVQVSNEVDILSPATGNLVATFTATGLGLVTGTSSNPMGPAAAGVCINQNTPDFIDGRRVRGRTFLVPVIRAGDSDGTPDSGVVNSAIDFGQDLITPIEEGPSWVVWHRPKGATPGSYHHITGVTVKDRFSVLRSRRD